MEILPGLDAEFTSISYNTKLPTTPTIPTGFMIQNCI